MTTSLALDRLDVDSLSSVNIGVELGTWLKVGACR
jgi:acyl carrier protein